MGAETVVERVRAIAERVAGGYGLEIFDVQYRREAPGMVLRVRIDRPGPASTEEDSVSVHDCANVSRDLSAIFDVEEIVPTARKWTARDFSGGGSPASRDKTSSSTARTGSRTVFPMPL